MNSRYFLAAISLVLALCAGAVADTTYTWDDLTLEDWTGGAVGVTVDNTTGALRISFREQAVPQNVSCTVRAPYVRQGRLVTIALRARTPQEQVSALRVGFRTTSGRVWYVPLSPPLGSDWVDYEIPATYSAGWTAGPLSTQHDFDMDLRAIDSVEVYVRRSGLTSQHDAYIDDFRLVEYPIAATANISGDTIYTGTQPGPVVVVATTDASSWTPSFTTATPGPGAYQISDATTESEYHVKAWRDANGNGIRDYWEAQGTAPVGPLLLLADASNIDVPLFEPENSDGISYWWLNDHFGTDEIAADGDPDGDGSSTRDEYVANTDPTDPLSVFAIRLRRVATGIEVSWNSEATRSYTVLRANGMQADFTAIATDVPGTGNEIVIEDAAASDAGPYFYKVRVKK